MGTKCKVVPSWRECLLSSNSQQKSGSCFSPGTLVVILTWEAELLKPILDYFASTDVLGFITYYTPKYSLFFSQIGQCVCSQVPLNHYHTKVFISSNKSSFLRYQYGLLSHLF